MTWQPWQANNIGILQIMPNCTMLLITVHVLYDTYVTAVSITLYNCNCTKLNGIDLMHNMQSIAVTTSACIISKEIRVYNWWVCIIFSKYDTFGKNWFCNDLTEIWFRYGI